MDEMKYNVLKELQQLLIRMNYFFGSKKNKVIDVQRTYLRIQFLTQEQKIKKQLVLDQSKNQIANQEEIFPFQDAFQCSYRFMFNAQDMSKSKDQNIKFKILVKEIISNILVTTDKQLANFYQSNVQGIKVVMQNNQALQNNDVIGLYDEGQASMYNPQQVLQIIYIQKSLWLRIKSKAKSAAKSIPKLFASLITKVISIIIGFMGFGSTSNLIFKFIPTKMIMQWVVTIVSIFFPALGPIIGISKLIL